MKILLVAAGMLLAAVLGRGPDVLGQKVGPDAADGAPLPEECMGDGDRCVVLTSLWGVNVYRSVGTGGFCDEEGGCSYPANAFGMRWQCVEFFNRFFWAHFGIEPLWRNARDLLEAARPIPDVEVVEEGGAIGPVPGDALVFPHGRFGHVAIVAEVGPGGVRVVEQNGSPDGTRLLPYEASTNRFVAPRGNPTGWIHAVENSFDGR